MGAMSNKDKCKHCKKLITVKNPDNMTNAMNTHITVKCSEAPGRKKRKK